MSDDRKIAETTFPVSFEQVFERLQLLERMFVELDGSFVWSGKWEDQAWQMDGMLYDFGGQLQRLELKGACPLSAWKELLDCLSWPRQRVLAHCLDWHCMVDINELLNLNSGAAHK